MQNIEAEVSRCEDFYRLFSFISFLTFYLFLFGEKALFESCNMAQFLRHCSANILRHKSLFINSNLHVIKLFFYFSNLYFHKIFILRH